MKLKVWKACGRSTCRVISGVSNRWLGVNQGDSRREILTVGPGGEIALPDKVRERYGMAPASPVRLIETQGGVLLIPLSDAPMSAELAQWQALSAETWEMFPFEEEPGPS
jgi:bifunctional DNA-binding transcriptional regulator/antitoxin component of YhaV-PrlF toxin-antitoxin module